jgi:hypothetical protein
MLDIVLGVYSQDFIFFATYDWALSAKTYQGQRY